MRLWVWLIALLGAAALQAQVDWAAYRPVGFVSDYAQLLEERERYGLESLLAEVNTQYGVQLAIVTLPSLERYKIDDIAKFFYQEWGVGRQTQNQSALLILSRADGQMHLYVGLGLRGVLNSRWTRGLESSVEKLVGQGEFNTATVAAATAIVGQVHEHAAELPSRRPVGRAVASAKELSINGLPVAALAALGFGGLLFFTTYLRANKEQKDASVYQMAKDFERNRTGPFGGKKPRWQ
jgi:uncharacterized membrane protein YgcG